MLAPSIYTWPPLSWIDFVISCIEDSKTPWVDGYVTIKAAKFSLYCSAFSFNSFSLIFPWLSVPITTTFMPAITAEAGLVPWAEDGIKHIFLWPCEILFKYALITINPAYSPWAPELGCNDVPENPVISFNCFSNLMINFWYPFAWFKGTKGCMLFHLDQLIGIISDAAFNFIVHEPKEIMEWVRDKSLFSRLLIYLIKLVSEWWVLKIFVCKNLVFLMYLWGISISLLDLPIRVDVLLKLLAITSTIIWMSLLQVASFIEIERWLLSI